MKKILLIFCVFAASLSFWSCTSEEIEPDRVSQHDYESDAEVLTKFVDVNHTTGEYFINESKVVSAADHIVNDDLTKLTEVNSLNRSKFERELDLLNEELKMAAQSGTVSQIVYNLYGGKTWIRTIDPDYPILIQESNVKSLPSTRSQLSYMELVPNLAQKASFVGPSTIQSVININMFGYKMYSFRITTNDGNKTPSGDYPAGGGSNSKAIVMSGSASMEQWYFTWNKTSSGSTWNFTGTMSMPTTIGQGIISVSFEDY